MLKVSVVVPARNEEKMLPLSLSALCRQSWEDFELIVVDSASTDRTGEVARSFGARVIRLEEPGIARARQAGFAAARGEFIASSDADSLVPTDWLERLVVPFRDPEVVGAFGPVYLSDGGPWTKISEKFFPSFQRANLRLGRPLFAGPNFAVRKEAFLKVKGFKVDGRYPEVAEDVQLAMKINREGSIVFLRNLTVATSARQFHGSQGLHGLRYVGYHAGVYLRVCWLGPQWQPGRYGSRG